MVRKNVVEIQEKKINLADKFIAEATADPKKNQEEKTSKVINVQVKLPKEIHQKIMISKFSKGGKLKDWILEAILEKADKEGLLK